MSKNRHVAKSVQKCGLFFSFSSVPQHTNWLGLIQQLCVTNGCKKKTNSLYTYPENVKTTILNIVVFGIKVEHLCAYKWRLPSVILHLTKVSENRLLCNLCPQTAVDLYRLCRLRIWVPFKRSMVFPDLGHWYLNITPHFYWGNVVLSWWNLCLWEADAINCTSLWRKY